MALRFLQNQLPPRNTSWLILLTIGFSAAISLLAYLMGGTGTGSAFALFVVLCVGWGSAYLVSIRFPAEGEFRRSLADTIGFALVRSFVAGVTVYLALHFAVPFKDLSGSAIMVQFSLFVSAWAFFTFFLEWFGRKAKT